MGHDCRCYCRPSAAVADHRCKICSNASGFDAAVLPQCESTSQTCGGAARVQLACFCWLYQQPVKLASESEVGEERSCPSRTRRLRFWHGCDG